MFDKDTLLRYKLTQQIETTNNMEAAMNIAQFVATQKTRNYSDEQDRIIICDLVGGLDADDMEESFPTLRGLLTYGEDSCYIEIHDYHGEDAYSLCLGNAEYVGELEVLEGLLFEFYLGEIH